MYDTMDIICSNKNKSSDINKPINLNYPTFYDHKNIL